ncbi:paxillin [Gorgonomyces haynaldii]|nr:paxillin [Gorgonomyces haynaldii]
MEEPVLPKKVAPKEEIVYQDSIVRGSNDSLGSSLSLHSPTKTHAKSIDDILSEALPSGSKARSRPHLRSHQDLSKKSSGNLVETRSAQNLMSSNSELKKPRKVHMCATCNEHITAGGAFFKNAYYHTEHFVCSVETCRQSLSGVLCFEMEGNLYCERDFHKRFSPECAYCKEPIKENAISALGKSFHQDHFFCSQCGTQFGPNGVFMEYDGKAYCRDDYEALFAGICYGCNKKLVGSFLSALNKTWHNDCFVCSSPSCHKQLADTVFYELNNKPYCEYHFYEAEQNICNSCQKPIIGRCVAALGQKFHPQHFQCGFCQKVLDSTSAGFKEKNHKAFCAACYLKLY